MSLNPDVFMKALPKNIVGSAINLFMNKKQKVLTAANVGLIPAYWDYLRFEDGLAVAFTAWFAMGVIYTGLFFILKPSRRE